MIIHRHPPSASRLLLALALCGSAHAALTDISTVPLNTYSAPSSTDVKPNILFVLDDSGSMDWDFMPDWACSPTYSTRLTSCGSAGQNPSSARSEYLFRNSSYNGVYYNPAVTYSPPVAVSSTGMTNATTYPSMTGQSTATGADSSSKPNWNAVRDDAYLVQSTASNTSNLVSDTTKPPYFFTTIPGEYCTTPSLRVCTTASTASSTYPYPAPLRWCTSSALSTCQAAFSTSYSWARSPSPSIATITIGGSSTAAVTVSSITVNGFQILSATSTGSTSTSAVATNIASMINACQVSLSGACTVRGYHADVSGSTITLTAPASISATPAVTLATGTMTVARTAFSAGSIPGSVLPTTISPSISSYPYPGSSSKAATRTDCAGSTCTYAEEMTNYANWWTYYKSRMQTMKTAASNAFATIDSSADLSDGISRFRLGYMTINNSAGSDFLNLGEFAGSQKFNWYNKLIQANPGPSTPLRAALATAGRLYAGKLNGTSLYGSTVVDPLQYSCQQNYTILSTDGFWNESSGFNKLDGSTQVGNQDALLPRPYYDGGSGQTQSRTSTLQSQTVTPQWLKSTSQLQLQTTTLQAQAQTSQLQLQTTTLQAQTQTNQLQLQTTTLQAQTQTNQLQLQTTTEQVQAQTNQLQLQTSQLQATIWHLQARTRTASNTYTQWADVNSCTYHTGTGYPYTQCQYGPSTITGVATCPTIGTKTTSTGNNAIYSGPTVTTACGTVITTAYATATSCTATTVPDASGFTNQCKYAGWTNSGSPGPAATCNAGAIAPSTGPSYTVGVAKQCITNTPLTSGYATASTCTATTTPDANGRTTQCQYAGWTNSGSPGALSTCNAASVAPSTGPSYTVGVARQCIATASLLSGYASASSCTATTTPDANGRTTQCQYAGWTNSGSPGSAATCNAAAVAPSTGPSYTVGVARQCIATASLLSGYASANSCTATTTPDANGQTTQCQYAAWTNSGSPGSAATCNAAAVAQSAGPSYTVGVARQCIATASLLSGYATASACTVSTTPDASGQTTQCQYTAWTTATTTTFCTALDQSTASPYTVGTATSCTATTPALGTLSNISPCTTSSTTNCQYSAWSAWSNTSSCTAVAQSTGPSYTVATATDCQVVGTGGTSNTLADVAAYYYNTDLRSSVAANGTGTCTGPVIAPATTPNDLCADNVPANGRDVATTQHMTTFTLGLGSQGQMIYAPNDGKDYWNDTTGDFFDVRAGTTANTSAGICSWQSSGACNWPTPASNSNANIDDLWHAAINGHGSYFSAKDPASLSAGLSSTLATIANVPRPGTAAAAASSNPNVSSSDNYVFSSSYKSVEWYGELIRQQISSAGVLTAQNWSAMRLLDCATTQWTAATSYTAGAGYRNGTTCYTVSASYTSGVTFNDSIGKDLSYTVVVNVDEAATSKVPATAKTSRTIYTKNGTSLVNFSWNTLSATQQGYFTTPTISAASGGLSQFCTSGGNCLSSVDQISASGQALVNFLRGDRSNEGTYFRNRSHVLGDIVSSEARYVKTPLFNFNDANFSAFKTRVSARAGMVYVGANDGMLHAFSADTGQEQWAYVPETVLPKLYQLADKNYATQHQFFVDDTPEVGDICPNAPSSTCTDAQWKTILVGGLNRGGTGYYAVDITDPTTPKLLWEFTDANLGYSYGNPRITKLKNGTWVVMLASGYNNADGKGRVYVLNANTGALIRSISNATGSATSPSGLAHLAAHVLLPDTDNTTLAVYGGDTLGNLWRFDVNDDIGASGYDAQLMVSLKDASGNAQPITAKPTVASVNGKPLVLVGTGRYLGTSDVIDTSSQTFYGVLDKSDSTTYGNPRTAGNGFVQQTVSNSTCPTGTATSVCVPNQVVRTSSNNAVDWTTSNGWYLDFLSGGERASTDSTLGLGSLLFTTIRPQSSSVSACGAPGTDTSASFLYVLNFLTGAAVVGANTVSGVSLGSGIVTRPVMIELSDGTVMALVRTSTSSVSTGTDLGNTLTLNPPVNPASSGSLRRVSWRELTTR